MARHAIMAAGAATVGPYSHAVAADGLVLLSGQTPIDPATGRLKAGSIGEQTAQCLANLGGVLEAAGLSLDGVVKCNVFLTDMADFPAMNEAYARHFREPYPARTTIGVAALPLGAAVEIEMIAQRRQSRTVRSI